MVILAGLHDKKKMMPLLFRTMLGLTKRVVLKLETNIFPQMFNWSVYSPAAHVAPSNLRLIF